MYPSPKPTEFIDSTFNGNGSKMSSATMVIIIICSISGLLILACAVIVIVWRMKFHGRNNAKVSAEEAIELATNTRNGLDTERDAAIIIYEDDTTAGVELVNEEQ